MEERREYTKNCFKRQLDENIARIAEIANHEWIKRMPLVRKVDECCEDFLERVEDERLVVMVEERLLQGFKKSKGWFLIDQDKKQEYREDYIGSDRDYHYVIKRVEPTPYESLTHLFNGA